RHRSPPGCPADSSEATAVQCCSCVSPRAIGRHLRSMAYRPDWNTGVPRAARREGGRRGATTGGHRGEDMHEGGWRRRWVLHCVLAGLLACAAGLAGCSRPPPEQALREAFEGLHAAVEARDASGVADVLAEDFIGPGGLDRDGARRMSALQFMRHGDVSVLPGPLTVELQDQHARVRFSAVLAGGSGRLLPDSAEAWQVDTGWRLVDGDWRMTSADWKPAAR